MPYYNDYGPKNTTCLHKLDGIPAGAFLAVLITGGCCYRDSDIHVRHDNQHFTISNGTHHQYIFYGQPPVFMRQLGGTNSLLLNFTFGSDRDWDRFTYKYTGKSHMVTAYT